jgi:CBS domain containing-hemolysin-like protein
LSASLGLLLLVACLLATAVYGGAETGFYTLSRQRLDLDRWRGRKIARLVGWLLQDDAGLLVTLLIGGNITLEVSSFLANEVLIDLHFPARGRGLVSALILTPVVFLFAEVLPKDLFRRRPHGLVSRTALFIAASRVLLWPLVLALRVLSAVIAALFGLEARAVTGYHGRELVLSFLEEGRRAGILPAHAEALAHNALKLRSIPISRVMLPWDKVVCLREGTSEEELVRTVRESAWTRLPVVDAEGRVLGYVHQIEVLAAEPGKLVLAHLRPLLALPPELSVARALLRLRASAARLALVGTPEAPVGMVALKDLVEEISGELATW